jgi:hypothetical protein
MGTDKEPVAPVSAGSSPAVLSTVGAWGLGTSKLKASIWRARNRGGSPSVASVCLGRVKEYCPFKDWSTQMAPSSVVFFLRPLKTQTSLPYVLLSVSCFVLSLSDLEVCCGDKIVIDKACVGRGRECGHD